MNVKNIVYLSSSTLPSRAANSMHVTKMAQALHFNGYKVTLIGKSNSSENVHDFYGIESSIVIKTFRPVRVIGKTYFFGFHSALYAKHTKPDLVLSRNLAATFFALKFGLQVIFETHDPFLPQNTSFVDRFFLKEIFKSKKLLRIVTITHKLKQILVDAHKIDPKRITVAPDGADLKDRDLIKKTSHTKSGVFSVGYVGHLYEGRGIELIFRLAQNMPDISFNIVGGDEEHIKHWRLQSVTQRNFTVHGFVEPSKLEGYYELFDVLLAPYQSVVRVRGDAGNTVEYMSPLKIFEYMATGKPIIASDLLVLKEILSHDINSLLCSPENVREWQEAILKIKNDRAYGIYLANNAFSLLQQNYTWQARAKNILQQLW